MHAHTLSRFVGNAPKPTHRAGNKQTKHMHVSVAERGGKRGAYPNLSRAGARWFAASSAVPLWVMAIAPRANAPTGPTDTRALRSALAFSCTLSSESPAKQCEEKETRGQWVGMVLCVCVCGGGGGGGGGGGF